MPRVRNPCWIVEPTGVAAARSGSTWIHCSSPVSFAKVLMSSCTTVFQSLTPNFCPTWASSPSRPVMTTGPEVWVVPTPSPLGSVIRVASPLHRGPGYRALHLAARPGGTNRTVAGARTAAGTGTGPVLHCGRVKHRAGAASYAPVRVSC